MSIDSNNPTTWNRPKWENNSCYANASLWGLLYNDIFIDLIKNTETKNEKEDKQFQNKTIPVDIINNNRTTIKRNLIEFHNSIQNTSDKKSPEEVYSYTRNIRESLTNISNSNWNTITADPQEFLSIISEQFDDINICNSSTSNTPENKFLPIINLPQKSIVTNETPKTISIKTNDDINECKFNQDTNGLIVQYGGPGAQIPEKFYSIGQYKLYAFLHYINEGHYACYFEFNDNWYIFDDFENNRNGSIVSVDLTKNSNKIIREECYLFFYKIDDSLKLGENVLFSAKFKFQKEATNQQVKPLVKSQVKPLEEEPEVFTSSIQKINKCEQYGNDWLNLFITEPGSTITKTKTKTGEEIVSVEKDGVTLTRISVPENCTFVEPQKTPVSSSFQSPTQSMSRSSSVDSDVTIASTGTMIEKQTKAQPKWYLDEENQNNVVKIEPENGKYKYNDKDITSSRSLFTSYEKAITKKELYDKADKALETLKQSIVNTNTEIPENIKNIIEKYPTQGIIVFNDLPNIDKIKDGQIIYVDGNIYVVYDKKKLYDITHNKTLTKTRTWNNSKSGGTKKRKAMNAKMTIKNIKNKLRRTKKYIINKRKTRKI